MRIFLVRHGITEANKNKYFVGWGDIDLAEEGVKQAQALTSCFEGEQISGLYSSDLSRAKKTAEIIGRSRGIKPVVTPLLREINFGEWEGLRFSDITVNYAKQLSLWLADPLQYSPPGGESLSEVCRRACTFLERLWLEDRNGTNILVSHGGTIRSLLHYYLGLGKSAIWDLTVENASISFLERKGFGVKVIYINRLDHLEGGC